MLLISDVLKTASLKAIPLRCCLMRASIILSAALTSAARTIKCACLKRACTKPQSVVPVETIDNVTSEKKRYDNESAESPVGTGTEEPHPLTTSSSDALCLSYEEK
jgi:hypothetical protein